MGYANFLEEWNALLDRRPTFRAPLTVYVPILAAWAEWPRDGVAPLPWAPEACRERWGRGVPLLSEATPTIAAEALEPLLGPVLDALAALGTEAEVLQRFARAWDVGEIGASAFFPERGRIGSAAVQGATGLSQEALGFLAYASLRPALDQYLAGCRPHLAARGWSLGVCPFCGAPPGFIDLLDDGQRYLACHLCGGAWTFSRLCCPYCGNQNPRELVRLAAEDKEEGYAIAACRVCHGYVKELDRRVRWNAGSSLVEDWGTPHLDLIAQREGYWRAVPTLIQLDRPGDLERPKP